MSAKHTPGPWTHDTSDQTVMVQVGKKILAICSIERIDSAPRESYEFGCVSNANARLIAAAPDLLSVVEELEESADYWSEYDVPLGIVDRLRAAIAKATGCQA